jgi:Putative peptidoglycan binding domain
LPLLGITVASARVGRALVASAALTAACALLAAPAAAANGGTASPIDTSQAGGAAPTAPKPTAPKPTASRPAPARLPALSGPRIVHAVCVPVASCSGNPHQVTLGGRLQINGTGIAAGTIVVFVRGRGAHTARALTSSLHHSSLGLVAAVPRAAATGKIYVVSGARRSKSYGPISVVSYKLHPPPPPAPPKAAPAPLAPTTAVAGSPFSGQGMWIWYVNQSDGGNLASIATQAKTAGVTTVFIKSSDGSSNFWPQFNPTLVQTLHGYGLKVCAWQYVYGTYPAAEADLGAQAVTDGADCLVIDAESEYEGRYASAQAYIDELRAKVGSSFPVGLASFPYVYYHESLPYSVFLGPGGAQYNAPQMYWKDIGTSVDTVYANTWISNRIYGRPIFPLGQTYSNPSSSDVLRFREEAVDYGASGWSFWDWQETPASLWTTLAAPLAPLTSVTPNATWPSLGTGSRGDQVLWMQEHLAAAIPAQATSGVFDATTAANLASFQTSHGLPATGTTTVATWQALLALTPIAVNWTGSGPSSSGSSGSVPPPAPSTTPSTTATTTTSSSTDSITTIGGTGA